MTLYKLNEDKQVIAKLNATMPIDEGGSFYPDKVDEAKRNEYGYYTFVTPPQTESTEYNRLISSTMVLIDGVYTLTYVYEDVTLEEAQLTKTNEINEYANGLILDANSNPTDGVTMEASKNVNASTLRRKSRADKLSAEILLSEVEKNEAKNDQKLSEFEGKIGDDTDKAISNMMKLKTTIDVSLFDVSLENWNTWVAPSF